MVSARAACAKFSELRNVRFVPGLFSMTNVHLTVAGLQVTLALPNDAKLLRFLRDRVPGE